MRTSTLLVQQNIRFLLHWQENCLNVSFPSLSTGLHELAFEIVNEDGMVEFFFSNVEVSCSLPAQLMSESGRQASLLQSISSDCTRGSMLPLELCQARDATTPKMQNCLWQVGLTR
jgi:hypothetical protein